jgi:hypothetical protein
VIEKLIHLTQNYFRKFILFDACNDQLKEKNENIFYGVIKNLMHATKKNENKSRV